MGFPLEISKHLLPFKKPSKKPASNLSALQKAVLECALSLNFLTQSVYIY